MRKRIFSLLLALLLAVLNVTPAFADNAPVDLTISTAEELMAFAEDCRLDSYSRGLSVRLGADIDLSGTAFFPIPSFSGRFDGAGHCISGLQLEDDGSVQGLFRYIEAGGIVENLRLRADISPDGSRAYIGGIAGRNSGIISNCSFEGRVSGGEKVGGIVGENGVSGIIEKCSNSGIISGLHFVGGIAGENNGVIRGCENSAAVNITEVENNIALSDISVQTLTTAESPGAVTDVGGIAGISCGVIRNSVNRGNVGYQSMGYNMGGIVGSQSGYLLSCENYGSIMGRKEAGGIAGQLEPVAHISFTTDTLQILQGQVDAMGGTVNGAAASARGAGNEVQQQVDELQVQMEIIEEAVEVLRDSENSDPDSVQAAQNALTSSLGSMSETMTAMGSTTVGALNSLSNSLSALQGQMNAVSGTLSNATDNLGGEFSDVSDKDTAADLGAKIESCSNYGTVSADYNAGGIIGAIAPANDLDGEDNYEIFGDSTLNFEGELRAVLLSSRNEAEVSAKKQNVGGVVGLQTMGLVKGCENSGTVSADGAEYVGGISGRSRGFIRRSNAKCAIYGDSMVGGIAGGASIVSDCISLVSINSAREKYGEVLGVREDTEEENPIRSNYYLSVAADMGAIDGISYDGLAQPLTLEKFLALSSLPGNFKTVDISFIAEDGSVNKISIPLGSALNEIPAVPEKANHIGEWAGLADADLSRILFDMSFNARYIGEGSVLESAEKRENGLSLLLMQGSFASGTELKLYGIDDAPQLELGERALEVWGIGITDTECVTKGRYLLPAGADADSTGIMLRGLDGSWSAAKTTVEGSYLIFDTDGSFDAISLIQTPKGLMDILLTAGGISLIAIFAIVALLVGTVVKQKKKEY